MSKRSLRAIKSIPIRINADSYRYTLQEEISQNVSKAEAYTHEQ